MRHRLPAAGTTRPRQRPLTSALLALGMLAATGGHAGENDRDLWLDASSRPATGTLRPVPAGGLGGLTRHPDLAAFQAATDAMDMQLEDFEGGFGHSASAVDCFQALGSHSNDACFAPGDLVPGFSMRSSRGSIFGEAGDSDLVALGPNVVGTPSTVVGAYQPVGATHISFEPDVVAVAMDVYDGLAGQAVAITAFAAGDIPIGTFTVTPAGAGQGVFVGVTSDTPINRIELDALATGGAELVDDLRFGGRAGALAAAASSMELPPGRVGDVTTSALSLTNIGDLPVVVAALPPVEAPFAWAAGSCVGATVAPGSSCEAQIAFAPAHEGRFETTLADHAVMAGPLVVAAQAQVEQLTPAPGHLEFGQVAAGSQSTPRTVEVSNFTAVGTRVESVATYGPFVSEGGSCQADTPLPPGASCTLAYRFAPTANGDFAGHVDLGLDGGTSIRVGLTGRTGNP